jgi:hypothetical protein
MATQTSIATHYHILSDGTVVGSKHQLAIGDRYQKPGTPQFLPIKFTVTNAEYTICVENSKIIVDEFNKRKTEIVRARTGWNSVSKNNVVAELYKKFVTDSGEPLMKESFFISMINFK